MTDEHDKNTDADAQLPDKLKDSDAQLPGKIKDSARQIWLAGLGAFNKAEEDTGRFFERLVQEGEQMENRTRGVVEKQLKSVEDRVEGVRERATGTWDKLEHLFDQRVSGALRRLGIYRQEDIMSLQKRVERLEAELDRFKKLTPGYNEEE
ncbi:poly(hydroxyalkanoate) granule-associated protein [Marinobacter psychrophilus]|jgi:poly(hydroxyalkanoate) granule-associated protein|uniref:Poly(Hydroxyalkanoate) granule-associated protein n=1 Tax=Marinobacter psychrophilus TaxID=330734 RepID=A0A0H4I4P2_9GAMM|nr:phasin family protein [Marinobacter psychrophilus]AKO52670.1 poly(hydroxyalkanoate) granule-associated protein [Marinobacter psychrophilus]